MSKYDFVIFDFDGTVADTSEGIFKSLQYSFVEMGDKVPDLSEMKKFIGPPIAYSFEKFYNVPAELVDTYIGKYRERYRAKGIFECSLYEGIKEALSELRKNGVKLGIASSKPLSLIYDVMNYLEITELFDFVSGVKMDNSRHSGKKELILNTMKNLNAENKSRVLMVGDRYFDIDGAAEAGVDSCGVLFGFGSREEFLEHNATYIIEEAKELLKLVL